jgi:hypothetical protein
MVHRTSTYEISNKQSGPSNSTLSSTTRQIDPITKIQTIKRGPGRPPGSLNKQKVPPPRTDRTLRSGSKASLLAQTSSATEDPTDLQDAMTTVDSKEWNKACRAEMSALEMNDTWSLVPIPEGKNIIQCKWVLKTKLKADGSLDRYKARLVAKGFSQKYGIDFEETFAQVIRYESVRMLLAIAAYEDLEIYQFDVRTAFLHGELKEEIYMHQPEGFSDGTNRVCLLKKGLYGLKQAPKAWNDKFHDFLSSHGLKRSAADYCLYFSLITNDNGKTIPIILGIYVDDGLICCNDIGTMNRMISKMDEKFAISVGDPDCFVGMQLTRDREKKTISISQSGYIRKILESVGMENCRPTITPGETKTSLTKNQCPETEEKKSAMSKVPYKQ